MPFAFGKHKIENSEEEKHVHVVFAYFDFSFFRYFLGCKKTKCACRKGKYMFFVVLMDFIFFMVSWMR